jgi:hypothetical protein
MELEVAILKSQAKAISKPPPKAIPLIAAIVGMGTCYILSKHVYNL